MKRAMYKRIWSIALIICMVVSMLPVITMTHSVEAEAVGGVNSLTCASFISNSTRRTYIDTMMKYYINNYSKLQTALDNGKSVVFMFEGGSDNYDSYKYVDSCGSTRLQAVCIVVQKNSSGNAAITFYSENCSSIPDDANWSTPGYETSGSTTIIDGIYGFQTVNHNGNYAGFNTYCTTGWYIPYSGSNGYAGYCDGINIHTRGVSYCGGSSYGWCNSAGCQVIGYGASSSNEYNKFMKTVAGISFNAYDGTQRTYSSGLYVDKGYYVVDRQLGLLSPSGTEYGSGSLIELYGKYDLNGITAFSTEARANASFGYTSDCTFYPSHCQFTTTTSTPVNSEPCNAGSNDSKTLKTASSGASYTSTGMYKNTSGQLWYQIDNGNGVNGYIYAGNTKYVQDVTSDITISNCSTPNGHVAGNIFYVEGDIASKYNRLDTAAVWVYNGFGTSGSTVTGYQDTVGGYSYTLLNSTIDYNTAFNSVPVGNFTYAVSVTYTNYYAKSGTTTGSNSGTKELATEYFVCIDSEQDQSSCSHSYTSTVLKAATCTVGGTTVKACSKCGLVNETAVAATGHSYGAWVTKNATCTVDGSRSRTCSNCADVQTEVLAATGHSYSMVTHAATCNQYAIYEFTCSFCGNNYKLNAGDLTKEWIDYLPAGMSASQFNSKTQYRYSDYQTVTSSASTMAGYTLKSSTWVKASSGSVKYVETWPSGFSTSSSVYSTYNKKGSKVTASETATAKTEVNSDQLCGYLYYHWCYADSYYSTSASSGSYTTFHAYYSTTTPDSYTCDTSDMSYKTSSSNCSNSNWWFVTDVYEQSYTKYNKQYTYERWTDFSNWSDTAVSATSTRKVETRTVYQLKTASLGTHVWKNGVCTSCGSGCSHKWSSGKCTACGLACTHTWNNGVCSTCGMSCAHKWSAGVCATCGIACQHSYSNGVCKTCGEKEPQNDYYLFGFINGADYACEADYSNMGIYEFVNGKLVTTFTTDSYVGVKSGDNANWYMTAGWLGMDTKSATLYNTSALSNSDKLYVPGGVQVTFTLVDNGDDTLQLSYTLGASQVVTPTISPKYPTLSFEDEILMNVYFTASNLDDVDEMGLITYSSKVSTWNVNNAEVVVAGYTYNSDLGFYCVTTDGIAAKCLGDTIYFSIYTKLKNGTYTYTSLLQYSPKTYAYNQLNSSSDAKLKSLVVAMLNYGAAAQTYFRYNTGALVNNNLTSTQKALVSAYNSGMVASVVSVNSSKVGIFTNKGGFSRKYPTISFEGAFCINYYFTPSATPNGNIVLYYWDQATYNSVATLTPANATGKISMSGPGEYCGIVEGIAAKDLDGTIYVAAGYNSGSTTYCTGVLAYSIGSYCVSQANGSTTMKPFAAGTAVYGYYAKNYFAA